jgi:hypothetical protein
LARKIMASSLTLSMLNSDSMMLNKSALFGSAFFTNCKTAFIILMYLQEQVPMIKQRYPDTHGQTTNRQACGTAVNCNQSSDQWSTRVICAGNIASILVAVRDLYTLRSDLSELTPGERTFALALATYRCQTHASPLLPVQQQDNAARQCAPHGMLQPFSCECMHGWLLT